MHVEGYGLPLVGNVIAVCVIAEFGYIGIFGAGAAEEHAVCVVPCVDGGIQLLCAAGIVISEVRAAVLAAYNKVGYGFGVGERSVAVAVGRGDHVAVFAVLIPEHSRVRAVCRNEVVGSLIARAACRVGCAHIIYGIGIEILECRRLALARRVVFNALVVVLARVVVEVGEQVALAVLIQSVVADIVNYMVARVVLVVVIVGLAVEHVAEAVVPEAVGGKVEGGNGGAVAVFGEVYISHRAGARLYLNAYRLIACRRYGGCRA